jgi:hypothetical protein
MFIRASFITRMHCFGFGLHLFTRCGLGKSCTEANKSHLKTGVMRTKKTRTSKSQRKTNVSNTFGLGGPNCFPRTQKWFPGSFQRRSPNIYIRHICFRCAKMVSQGFRLASGGFQKLYLNMYVKRICLESTKIASTDPQHTPPKQMYHTHLFEASHHGFRGLQTWHRGNRHKPPLKQRYQTHLFGAFRNGFGASKMVAREPKIRCKIKIYQTQGCA